jgi:transposase
MLVTMYIRKSIRTYGNKTYVNHLLVKSVQTPKGPRQKTICSLGDLSPRPVKQWLKLAHKIEDSLAGQGELLADSDEETREIMETVRARRGKDARGISDLVSVHADKVETTEHREAGSVHVAYQFWKRLGLDTILGEIGVSERARTLTCAMALNRLIFPLSEHAMPEWIRGTAIEDILGVDLKELSDDALYRNLDRLYPNRAAIESALVKREKSLFNLVSTVFFYDITSTYFEGEANGNPKAKRGYSRDKRPDCKQVLVGLAIGKEGFPLAHEVMEGNLRDHQTLDGMLQVMEERVGLSEGQTVVIDRGMANEESIEQIVNRKLHYIVASRQSERDQWLAEFEELEEFEEVYHSPSPLNPFQKKPEVKIKKIRKDAMTYVLCISSGRLGKDKAIRKKQEERFLRDIAKLRKRIQGGRLVQEAMIHEAIGRIKERYPRVCRYYEIEVDRKNKTLHCQQHAEKMQKAELLDGSYLLKTDRDDLSADEIWRVYMTLTRAEAAFRAMKSPLSERPIFHQIQRRVETHIFLCVLAYHLLVAIENTLLQRGVHTSWWTIRQILRTHQICTIVLPADNGNVLNIRKASRPEADHNEVYRLLRIPIEIMSPKKFWTDQKGELSD